MAELRYGSALKKTKPKESLWIRSHHCITNPIAQASTNVKYIMDNLQIAHQVRKSIPEFGELKSIFLVQTIL